MVEDPVIVIQAEGKTFIYHLWSDISLEDQFEVTNKPASKGFGEIIRPLQSSMTFNIKCSDEAKVPTLGRTGIYQDIDKVKQVANLRGLIGKSTTVTTRTMTLAGVVRSVKIEDSGQWDQTVLGALEIRVIEAGGEDEIGELRFGTIKTIPIPASAKDPANDDPTTKDGNNAEMPNAPHQAGGCPSVTRLGGIIPTAERFVENISSDFSDFGKWFNKSVGKESDFASGLNVLGDNWNRNIPVIQDRFKTLFELGSTGRAQELKTGPGALSKISGEITKSAFRVVFGACP